MVVKYTFKKVVELCIVRPMNIDDQGKTLIILQENYLKYFSMRSTPRKVSQYYTTKINLQNIFCKYNVNNDKF